MVLTKYTPLTRAHSTTTTHRKMDYKLGHTSGIGQYLSRWKVDFV